MRLDRVGLYEDLEELPVLPIVDMTPEDVAEKENISDDKATTNDGIVIL